MTPCDGVHPHQGVHCRYHMNHQGSCAASKAGEDKIEWRWWKPGAEPDIDKLWRN